MYIGYVCLNVYMHVCMYVYLSIYLSISVCLTIYLCIYVCVFINVFMYFGVRVLRYACVFASFVHVSVCVCKECL